MEEIYGDVSIFKHGSDHLVNRQEHCTLEEYNQIVNIVREQNRESQKLEFAIGKSSDPAKEAVNALKRDVFVNYFYVMVDRKQIKKS